MTASMSKPPGEHPAIAFGGGMMKQITAENRDLSKLNQIALSDSLARH